MTVDQPPLLTSLLLHRNEDSKVKHVMYKTAQLTIVHGKECSLQLTYRLEFVLCNLHQRLDLE